MSLFYFTFGMRYKREVHPKGGHPDGWFAVEAPSWKEARDIMVSVCGIQWAFQYNEQPSIEIYPRGELKRLEKPVAATGEQAAP